jgi:hypothetical protein
LHARLLLKATQINTNRCAAEQCDELAPFHGALEQNAAASGLRDPSEPQLLEIDLCLPMASGCQFL